MKRANTRTFASIEADSRVPAAKARWSKAKTASRFGKVARDPGSRRVAYSIKYHFVSEAIVLAPERVQIGDASKLHEGVLGIHFEGGGGLHVPIHRLSPPAAIVLLRLMGFRVADLALGVRQ